MIEPGFPTLLAHPALAFALAIAALAAAVAALLRAGSARSAAGQVAYWQALALLSEILLALGLVGLALFGGRAALGSDTLVQQQRLRAASGRADTFAGQIETRYCAGAGAPHTLAPFNPAVAARELCAIVRQRAAAGTGSGSSAGTLQVTAAALRDFGQRYPGCVDNVFSRNNDCERTIADATGYAQAIDAALQATLAVQRAGDRLVTVNGGSDGGFALAALLLAAAGMAIRIARAARPYWPARASQR